MARRRDPRFDTYACQMRKVHDQLPAGALRDRVAAVLAMAPDNDPWVVLVVPGTAAEVAELRAAYDRATQRGEPYRGTPII